MAQQEIDVGSFAGDGTGEPLRDAFNKINENFTELYSGNVQVTAANVLVESVAGRTGNVVLTVNDVAQAASKSYVDSTVSANIATVNTTTNSLSAAINAANAAISSLDSQVTTISGDVGAITAGIETLAATKADITYVDQSIELALSSNAILADVASVNANVAAANAAIALRANLQSPENNFVGNIHLNFLEAADAIRTDTYFIAGSEATQGLGQNFANPAGLFFGNTVGESSRYYQLNLQNLDPHGSGDLVITADDGNDLSHYAGIGIAGSNYDDTDFPSIRPHDGYFYVNGGNLTLQSSTNDVSIMAGGALNGQLTVTASNFVKLGTGVKIRFPDGTVQSTAFGGNADLSALTASISATNVAVAVLQANAAAQEQSLDALLANAGSQSTILNTLTSNSAAQAVQINSVNANVAAANLNIASTNSLVSIVNANVAAANLLIASLINTTITQALDIGNLQGNTQEQESTILALQANAVTQELALSSVNANVVSANSRISLLSSSVSTHTAQIGALNANVAAANVKISTLLANAASQSLDIDNIYANINYYFANIAISNAKIEAANASIIVLDANLGSTTTNVSMLQSDVVSQALEIDLINANVAAANAAIDTKAGLDGAIFNGNIQADYLIANANVITSGIFESIQAASTVDYPNLGGRFINDVDSYFQVVMQNLNSGENASAEFVITADVGDDLNNYVTIGINSSNYNLPWHDSGFYESPLDGFIECVGGNLAVRTTQDVILAANTSAVKLLADGAFSLVNANLQFADGSIQTTANVGDQPYTPNNVANWNGTITNIQQALDELAARLRALE